MGMKAIGWKHVDIGSAALSQTLAVLRVPLTETSAIFCGGRRAADVEQCHIVRFLPASGISNTQGPVQGWQQ
jgi:hypothetical protein